MKKLMLLISFLVCGLSAAVADEYVVSRIDCIAADGLYDRSISFKYDDSENVYYLYRSNYLASYWFTLTPEKLDKFRTNLAKVQEWSKLAKENKSSITKELPDSKISVTGTMKRGNDWYTTIRDIGLNFFFISKVTDDAEVVTCMLRGGEVSSRQNQYIDIEFESIVFINNQIDDLIKAISPETVEAAKQKHKQEKSASDMFN